MNEWPRPNVQEQRKDPEAPHTSCPYCHHDVPVYVEGEKMYIAGHDYIAKEEEEVEYREHQVDGDDIVSYDTISREVPKHCDGGSLKIIGFVEDEHEETKVSGLPENARVTRIHIDTEGKVTAFYKTR